MKIFFIDPNNNTAQVNYPLVEKLIDLGNNVHYFSSFNRWDSDYYEQNYSVKSNYIFFKLANKISNQNIRQVLKGLTYPFNLFQLLIIIIKKKPQIIHFNNITISFIDYIYFNLLKKLNFKIILTQHNYQEHEKKTISKFKIKAFNATDRIICLSDYTKNQFLPYLQKKVTVISHGNVYEKEITKYVKNNVSKKNKNKHQILFFGLIRPYKGIENLIDAYFYLPESLRNNITIKIIGKAFNNKYIEELKKKIKNIDNILLIDNFLDYKDIIQNIQEADIGILPYTSATQSGVPYLYAGLYKPIIITDVGALAEQVSGTIAEIAKPQSKSIAKAIKRMIDIINENKLNLQIFKDFNNKNSWHNTVSKYVELYKAI